MDTLSQYGPTTESYERAPRRRVSRRQSAQALSNQPPAPAFLTHRFLPLAADHAVLHRNKRVESEFFRSVDHLVTLYRLSVPKCVDLPYPLNIHAVFQQLKEQLKTSQPDLSLAIVQTDKRITTVATVKAVAWQDTLYYIPLLPLFKLLRRKQARHVAPILVGIAAMIYQKLGIPMYTERNSYLADVYSILHQWVDDTEAERTEQETAQYYREFRRADAVGYHMQRKLRQPLRIIKLSRYVQEFKPVGPWQNRLRELAGDFLALGQKFPRRCFFRDIPTGIWEEDMEDEDRIRKDNYLSFVYDNDGCLGEEMEDYVNTSLQDCPVVDEPVTVQYFNEPQPVELHDATYQKTCLFLLNEFCHLLNDLDHDEY